MALRGVGDGGHRHAAGDQRGVQVAVLDLVDRLRERAGILLDVVAAQAVDLEQVGDELVLAGAGRARGDALALQVLDAVDAGVGAGDQLHRLGVERTQGAQVLHRAAGELCLAVVGRIQDVGGDEGRFDLAVAQQLGVGHRGARGFGRGGELLAVHRGLVGDQLREHAAQRVVGAAGAAGGDAEEHALLREGGGGGDRGQGQAGDGMLPGQTHGRTPVKVWKTREDNAARRAWPARNPGGGVAAGMAKSSGARRQPAC